jgi:hypothetical protein
MTGRHPPRQCGGVVGLGMTTMMITTILALAIFVFVFVVVR